MSHISVEIVLCHMTSQPLDLSKNPEKQYGLPLDSLIPFLASVHFSIKNLQSKLPVFSQITFGSPNQKKPKNKTYIEINRYVMN